MRKLNQNEKNLIVELKNSGLSSRKICDKLGWHRTRKSTVNDFLRTVEAKSYGYNLDSNIRQKTAKIVVLDIEKTHHVSCHFRQWDENLSQAQKIREGHILSYSAMFVNDLKVFGNIISAEDLKKDFIRNIETGNPSTKVDEAIVKELWDILDKADVVIAYNGKSYDVKEINSSFLKYGMPPPSPYKVIDPLQTAKRMFKLPFNKLDYLAEFLGVTRKISNSGHLLWKSCLLGDESSIKEMLEYNNGDIITLYEVWLKLRGWDNNGVNLSLYSSVDGDVCPHCSGTSFEKRDGKFVYTQNCQYQLYVCNSCGAQVRGNKNLREIKNTLRRVV